SALSPAEALPPAEPVSLAEAGPSPSPIVRSPSSRPSIRILNAGSRRSRLERVGTDQYYRLGFQRGLRPPWAFAPRPRGRVYLIVVVCACRTPLHSLMRCRPVGEGNASIGSPD